MGLEDLIPEDKSSGSSSSSSSKSVPPEENPDKTVIQGPNNRKKVFDDEHWEDIRDVIHSEMGYNVNVVLNSPADERWEIVHEAALLLEGKKRPEELEHRDENRCGVCDKAIGDSGVEIDGVSFHPHHTAGQIAKELNNNT